jgi:hypothetical protein
MTGAVEVCGWIDPKSYRGPGSPLTTGVPSDLASPSRGVNSPLPLSGRCVIERCGFGFTQNCAAILLHFERARNQPKWETAPLHCSLHRAWDEKLIGMLTDADRTRTTARRDFSRARVVCNDSETGHFLTSCQKFKKI